MITHTYTKTYALMHPWAETDALPREYPGHDQHAREGDLCCAPDCDEPLVAGDTVYAVIELGRADARPGRGEPWVCWRHVRPDDGPLRA
jgi:hypothetical protein